jgi:hypothetical protein
MGCANTDCSRPEKAIGNSVQGNASRLLSTGRIRPKRFDHAIQKVQSTSDSPSYFYLDTAEVCDESVRLLFVLVTPVSDFWDLESKRISALISAERINSEMGIWIVSRDGAVCRAEIVVDPTSFEGVHPSFGPISLSEKIGNYRWTSTELRLIFHSTDLPSYVKVDREWLVSQMALSNFTNVNSQLPLVDTTIELQLTEFPYCK